MKKIETAFLKEIYSTTNDGRNDEQIISPEEEQSITMQQQAGQSGNEEAEDIFVYSTYHNRK